MNKLEMKNHMYIDYLVVALFLLGPILLGLEGVALQISFALAAVHTIVTLLTFTRGFSLISSTLHGAIELLVAPVLIGIPWAFGFANHTPSLAFYSVMGLSTAVVWALTDYRTQSLQLKPSML